MLEMRNDFYVTDNDSMQCCKDLGMRKYLFTKAIWLDTCKSDTIAANAENDSDNYVVVSSVIDVSKMSEPDIEFAISGFYESISDMENKYSLKISELDQFVAECEFENFTDDSCFDYVSEIVSLNEAKKIIQIIIGKY